MKLKVYFVAYRTDGGYINSFLVTSPDASAAWDEAVTYLEEKYPEIPAVITKFEKVE